MSHTRKSHSTSLILSRVPQGLIELKQYAPQQDLENDRKLLSEVKLSLQNFHDPFFNFLGASLFAVGFDAMQIIALKLNSRWLQYLADEYLSQSEMLAIQLELISNPMYFVLPKLVLAEFLGYKFAKYLQNKFLNDHPLGLISRMSNNNREEDLHYLKPLTQKFVTKKEIQLRKSSLVELRDKLESRNVKMRFFFRVFLIANYLMSYDFIPPILRVFLNFAFLSIFRIAFTNVRHDAGVMIKAGWKQIKCPSQKEIIDEMLSSLHQKPSVLSHDKTEFNLVICETKSGASKKDMMHALDAVFMKHDINVVEHNHGFIVGANVKISQKTANQIVEDVQLYINRRHLRIELDEIFKLLQNYLFITEYARENFSDKNNNENYSYFIQLNPKYSEELLFKLLNQKNLVKVINNVYKLEGVTFVTQSQWEDFEQAFNVRKSEISASVLRVEQDKTKPVPSKPKRSTEYKAEIKTVEVKKEPEKEVKIDFGNGRIFDSTQSDCPIKEIRAFYWPRYSHFGIYQSKAADKKVDAAFETAIDKGIVPPTAHSGVVKGRIRFKDSTGWHTFIGLKLKINGAQRHEEINNTQVCVGTKVLHFFDNFNPTHR